MAPPSYRTALDQTLKIILLIFLGLQSRGGAQTVRVVHTWQQRPSTPAAGLCKGADGNFYGTTSVGGGEGFGTVFQITPSGVLTVIHSFARTEGDTPLSSLVQGADGYFYGTTSVDGPNSDAAIFKVNSSGVFSNVIALANTTIGGAGPMILASDGNFYGCASDGGSHGAGAIYKLTPAGQFSIFYNFTSAVGSAPFYRLLQGADGSFYGTAPSGGANSRGTVFKVTSAGVGTALFSFPATGGNSPLAGLVLGSDGNFYGAHNAGIFRISPTGSYASFFTFVSATGTVPRGELVAASDGFIYGTTISGGTNGFGVVYRINTAGQYAKVLDFTSAIQPSQFAEITESSPGHFIGVTNGQYTGGLGTVFTATPQGNLTLLKSMSDPADITPSGPLVEGASGNLFGTTTNINSSSGAVFKVAPAGVFSTLQSFSYFDPIGQAGGGVIVGSDSLLYGFFEFSSNIDGGGVYKIAQSGPPASIVASFRSGPDPHSPRGQLVQGPDGAFYGVGSDTSFSEPGSVFKVTAAGVVSVVHSFTGNADGSVPIGTLTLGSDGKLYGATEEGGNNDRGTIFRVSPGATPSFTTVATFTNTNGQTPTGVLIAGTDGNVYGTTLSGGASNRGTIFKITPAGAFSMVAQFASGGPLNPRGPFVIAPDGNFYGVSNLGGSKNLGCVYKATPAGVVTVLTNFVSTGPNTPMNGLTLGVDGFLYGTTTAGGANSLGSVFKVSTAGAITHLAEFDYTTGDTPAAPIFRASDNRLYGLNQNGGTAGGGTLYAIDTAPFVTTLPATALAASSAQLSASVHPNGLATTVVWDYGPTTQYGATSSPPQNGGSTNPTTVATGISGLAAHTTYHFRAKATNSLGTALGQDLMFVTADDPPVATDDHFHRTLSALLALEVLANDSDIDGDSLSISQVSNGAHGSVTTDGRHAIYTPGTGFDGNDTFTYTVTDGFGGSASGQVTLSNAPPIALDVSLHASLASLSALELLGSDSDPDGDSLSISSVGNGARGTVSTDGQHAHYSPGPSFDGNDVFAYTIGDGCGGSASAAVHLQNISPVATNDSAIVNNGPVEIDVLANDSDPDGDSLSVLGTTNGSFGTTFTNGTTVTYVPGNTYFGEDTFTYTLGDGHGGSTIGTVSVSAMQPIGQVVFTVGNPVPAEPFGTEFRTFGIPAINNSNQIAFTSATRLRGIPSAILVSDGVVLAHKGDPAPGIAGASFASFKDPALNNNGEVAFLASLAGPPVGMAMALFTSAVGQVGDLDSPFTQSKSLQVVAQTGILLPEIPGAFIKTITSFVLQDNAIFFTATLGGFAVNAANSPNRFALFEWTPGTRRLLARTGDSLDGKLLKSFTAITGSAGSSGQSRGAALPEGLVFRATFRDNSQAVLVFNGTDFVSVAGSGETAPDMKGAKVRSLGQPIINAGGAVAFCATMFALPSARNSAVFAQSEGDVHRLFGRGDLAPDLAGLLLGTSKDPVNNGGEDLAAITQLSGPGLNATNNQAILYMPAAQPPQIVARLGAQPPGVPQGAQWRTFPTAVLPEDMGPAFLATMTPGLGGVDKTNLLGLWGTDGSGELKLLFRQGQPLGNRTVRSFTIFSRVGDSPDQTRAFNAARRFVLRAVLDNGSQALVEIAVP